MDYKRFVTPANNKMAAGAGVARAQISRVLDDRVAVTIEVNEDVLTTITGSTATGDAQRSRRKCILMGDVSGSMAGAPFNIMRDAMIRAAETLGDACQLAVFGSRARMIDVAQLRSLHAAEGTYFAPAFALLAGAVNEVGGGCHVIFFTDGQASDVGTALDSALVQFAEACKGAGAVVHSIGFSADHDVRLLTRIQEAGAEPGIFQYIDSTNKGDIDAAIAAAVTEVAGSRVAATVSIGTAEGRTETVCVSLQPSDASTTWQATLVANASEHLAPGCRLTFELENAARYEAVLESGDEGRTLMHRIHYVDAATKELAVSLQRTANVAQGARALERLNDEVGAVYAAAQKMRSSAERETRRAIMQRALESKTALSQMLQLVSSAVGRAASLTTETLAKLYDAAYKGGLRRSLRKKIDQRTEQNAARFAAQDSRRKELAAQALGNEERAELAAYACAISAMDGAEVVASGDALGLGLQITRTPAAVADPSQMEVVAIASSFVSVEAFRDAIEFAVGVNPDAHGGFGAPWQAEEAPHILTGVAREKINAVLVLHLSPRHWSMGKLVAPPLYGWQTTLDPFGYAPAQSVALPFLVYARLLEDMSARAAGPTEFQSKLEKLVLETCVHTLRDFGGDRAIAEAADAIRAFAESAAARTVDRVPSLRIMLAHMRVLTLTGLADVRVGDWPSFARALVEEAWRRETRPRADERDPVSLAWDRAQFADTFASAYRTARIATVRAAPESTGARARMLARLGRINPAAVPSPQADVVLSQVATVLPAADDVDAASLALEVQRVASAYSAAAIPTGVRRIQSLASLIVPAEHRAHLDASTYGAATLAVMAVQNFRHARNADRRAAIDDNTYRSPFEHPAAALAEWIRADVVHERQRAIDAYEQSLVSGEANALAARFAATDDPIEAAGILLGTYMGRETFPAFVRAVCDPATLLATEKMRMLMEGKYAGAKLFADIVDNTKREAHYGDLFWHPRHRTVNAFARAHRIDEVALRSIFPRRAAAALSRAIADAAVDASLAATGDASPAAVVPTGDAQVASQDAGTAVAVAAS